MSSKKVIRTSKLPHWDLTDLYTAIDDPKIFRDQRTIHKKVESLAAFRGKINAATDALTIHQLLQTYEDIMERIAKIQAFAQLSFSTNSSNQRYGAFLQHTHSWSTATMTRLLFIELELAALSQKTLHALSQHPALQDWRHYLRRQVAWQPHRLTEAEEELLHLKSLTGRHAFIRLYEQEAAARSYQLRLGQSTKKVSETKLLHLMHDARRPVRQAAMQAMRQQLQHDSRLTTFIMNTLIQDYAFDTDRRGFAHPADMRHLENEIDRSVVDMVTNLIVANYHMVADYYRFKKKLLGLNTLYQWDRYAPLQARSRHYRYPEAQAIILEAFAGFSPKFADVARLFFTHDWIDAQPRSGKQGGGYCIYVTPDRHPYILVNFHGSATDVMTLAHELGHGVNAYLARAQNYLHFDWPLAIAETTSVFAETVVFNHLKKNNLSRQQKLALYTHRIESIFATVFRQTAMYRFEQLIHEHRRSRGELSTEELNNYWHQTQQEMFGNSVKITAAEDIRWSGIPHFIHTPFYVYAYAFGELLSLSLIALYEENPATFVPTYFTFLAAGGSASPTELLALFNVDMHDKMFWQRGLDKISDLIAEAKTLV